MKAQIQDATLIVVFRWIPKDSPVFCTSRSGCRCSRCVARDGAWGEKEDEDDSDEDTGDDPPRGIVGVARPRVSAAILVPRQPDEPRMMGPNNIVDRRVLSREAAKIDHLTQASLATANDEPSLIPNDYWEKLLNHNDAYVPWCIREKPEPSPSAEASGSMAGHMDEGDDEGSVPDPVHEQRHPSATIHRKTVDASSLELNPSRPLSPWALLLLERRSGPNANPFLEGVEPQVWYYDNHVDGEHGVGSDCESDLAVNLVMLPCPQDVVASIFELSKSMPDATILKTKTSAVATLGPRAVSRVATGLGLGLGCVLGLGSRLGASNFCPLHRCTAQTAPEHGNMAENVPPAAHANAGEPLDRAKEMAEYEKEKKKLKDLLAHRGTLSQGLARIETQIADLENKYLESTPSGNILIGFDNYTKGVSGAAASRRKTGASEQNRVFSRSSISYNALNQDLLTPASGASTPAATPVSAAFANKDKDGTAMNAPTPSSTHEKKISISKKRKEKPAVAEDSETDSHNAKKVRTSFSAPRK